MTFVDRLDGFQRRHPWLSLPLGVVYKFFEDAGMHLVATLAYYAIVAAFPVALLMAGLCAALVQTDPSVQSALASSLLGSVPIVRTAIATGSSSATSGWALVLALLGSAYGGLGVAGAFQHAMNQVWAVPRNARPNPLRSRLRSVVILALLIGSVVGSSIIAGAGPGPGAGGSNLWPVAIFGLNIGLVVVAMRYATAAAVPLRAILPGAVIAGLLWPQFQVTSMSSLRSADTATAKGVALTILGLVALLHLGALVVVLCAELNVVLARRLYPRALLTPFTDAVDLTDADRSSYTAQAASQRFKAYQQIAVEFDPRPDRRT